MEIPNNINLYENFDKHINENIEEEIHLIQDESEDKLKKLEKINENDIKFSAIKIYSLIALVILLLSIVFHLLVGNKYM